MANIEKLSKTFNSISPWFPAFHKWSQEYYKNNGEYPAQEERRKKLIELRGKVN